MEVWILALVASAVVGLFLYQKRAEVSSLAEENKNLKGKVEECNERVRQLEKEAENYDRNKDINAVRLENEIQSKQKEIESLKQELEIGSEKKNSLGKRITVLEKQVTELETRLKSEREERKKFNESVEKVEERFKTAFENLGNKIFESKSEKFKEQNREGVENILKPLKEDIKEFKDRFTETDKGFAGKFGELKNQIEDLSNLNKTIGTEAHNLTKALKADSKQQGGWGELVLERTLEMSGLREGKDYERQESFSQENEEGIIRRILDVVVHLPEGKDIIIDSKVSLTDYERYCSSDDEGEKAAFLRDHLNSVERHIKNLGGKNYQNIPGIRTLNFVLMFIPIEPAYILTVNEDKNMFQKALNRNVVLACPSTLFAVLRTVHSLWRIEDQNANAQIIAEEAGKIYDKLVVFVKKMERVGKNIDTAKNSYEEVFLSLSTGKNNLISQSEKMKELGARVTKSLPASLVDGSKDKDTS